MSPSRLRGFTKCRRKNVIVLRRVLSRVLILFLIIMALSCVNGIASGSSDDGHGAAPSKGWVATDWYRVLNFAVLATILFYIARKIQVPKLVNGRIEKIQSSLDDLETLKKDAEKRLAECNEKLYALDKEAEKIIAAYIQQGNEAKDKILKEAEAASEKLKLQARKNIQHEFEKARSKLEAEIFEKAIIKAEELIKSKITVEDQDQLVNEYLDKVVEQ